MKRESLFDNHPQEQHGVMLSRTRKHHPYLLTSCFDSRNEQFNPWALESLLRHHSKMVLDGYRDDVKGIEKLIDIFDKTGFNKDQWPDGLLGNNRFRDATAKDWNREHSITIGLTKAKWKLQRFGHCLGICPVAIGRGNDELHEETIRVLERVLITVGSRYLHPFYQQMSVVTRNYYGTFNLVEELAILSRHIPSVTWFEIGDAIRIRQELVENFIQSHKDNVRGIQVGTYHELPIYAKLLWNHDADGQMGDPVRRRGIIDHSDDAIIRFHESYSDFKLMFFVSTDDKESYIVGGEINHVIDFETEQFVMENAARVLYNGLVDVEYESIVAQNPHWVRMQEKKAD